MFNKVNFDDLDNDKFLKLILNYFEDDEANIYVVGGKVREALLGLKSNRIQEDIDICGNLPLDELLFFCNACNIENEVLNWDLETIKMFYGGKVYEYARFRKENYSDMYTHVPSEVVFTDELGEDTLRRDFTINAIYYDIKAKRVIDACGGMKDLENKIIKACGLFVIETLMYDPARIIRLVELASRLEFKIDDDTMKSAKQNAKNVFKLSSNRLRKEVLRLKEQNKYGEDYSKYLSRVNALLSELNISEIMAN